MAWITFFAAAVAHACCPWKDFELFEDGVAQKIAFFGRDQLPLSVVLLFDLTDSVRGVLRRRHAVR